MNTQTSSINTLPTLASPELDRLRSRLDQGLLRLAKLSQGELCEVIAEAQPPVRLNPLPAPEQTWETPAANQPSERRAFPRRDGNCRVLVCRLPQHDECLTPQQIEWRLHSTSLKGTLVDLSLNGTAVLLAHPLSTGDNIVLRLVCPRRDRHLDQYAHVVRCEESEEVPGQYDVMCRFPSKLTLEQVTFFSRFLNDNGLI